jgi:hypothetical protein
VSNLDLDALERLRKAATGGPWKVTRKFRSAQYRIQSTDSSVSEHYVVADCVVDNEANVNLIVETVNSLDALIERVRKAEADNEKLRGTVEDLQENVVAKEASLQKTERVRDAAVKVLDDLLEQLLQRIVTPKGSKPQGGSADLGEKP